MSSEFMLLPQIYRAQLSAQGHTDRWTDSRKPPMGSWRGTRCWGTWKEAAPGSSGPSGRGWGMWGAGREPPGSPGRVTGGAEPGCVLPTGPRRWAEDQLGAQTPGLRSTWASEDGAARWPWRITPTSLGLPAHSPLRGAGGEGGSHLPTQNQGCTGHAPLAPQAGGLAGGAHSGWRVRPRADGTGMNPGRTGPCRALGKPGRRGPETGSSGVTGEPAWVGGCLEEVTPSAKDEKDSHGGR